MDELAISTKLLITALFVALNGFFVASEFALVKVRAGRINALAAKGNGRARTIKHMLDHLDLYLSGCQLGITLASLVLGWLAEPAVAAALLAGAAGLGWELGDTAVVHGVALAIAMTVITTLHMTVGEQAPKIWALERAETVSLAIAYPLRVFVAVLRPLIWTVNLISNTMVRAIGIETGDMHDTVHSVAELRQILSSSASAGQISGRQRLFAENVLALIALEVRHVMLPRVDVAYLSLEHSAEQNLEDLHRCGHSRYPLCKAGLDTVIGIVHTRDVLPVLLEGRQPDLENLARKALVVPDSQPLPRFIAEAQASRRHCAVVIDEHGTTVGLAFLEDALEEIVGPIHDEFDRVQTDTEQNPDGSMVFDGGVPLPDLELFVGEELDDDADTVGGFVVGRLGRLPEPGDQLDFGEHRATVMGVSRRRVTRVRIERIRDESR